MKFYEFNNCEYYALIGAENKEKAIQFYSEVVTEMEEDGEPEEVSQYRAKTKLLEVIENWNEKEKFSKEFNENASREEPYLILIDSGLI